MAERTVQTVKESFLKSKGEGKTLLDILQVLRSTPVGNGLPAPAVLLQKRNLRGGLLFTKRTLEFQNVHEKAVKVLLQRRQANQSFNSSARSKALSNLLAGTPVRVRVSKKWIKGVMKSVCPEPNSYIVSTDCGRLFRRNRQAMNVDKVALRQVQTTPHLQSCSNVSPRLFNPPTVTRDSRVFMDDWTPGVEAPTTFRPVNLNPTVEQPEEANVETVEDFMEAFHGFELGSTHQTPRCARFPSRRSSSTEARGVFPSPDRSPRSHSMCSRDIRVTRSGRPYGIR